MTQRYLSSTVVYATTAANPKESSYACYYDEERGTYLGDWYSVNWMEDSDVVRPLPGPASLLQYSPQALVFPRKTLAGVSQPAIV
jgi:hypothetical protein